MSTLSKMILVATAAHELQTDRGGKPYILHPLAVMRITEEYFGYDLDLMMIAVGHDLIEDTLITEESLRNLGFSDRVVNGILALSKDESKTYEDYKLQVKQNKDAMKVKYADLTHNTDLSRLENISEADRDRTARYSKFKDELLALLAEVA